MSNNKSNQIIKEFIANTIDIYNDDAINTFIDNGNLNIDTLLRHHITKLSILYNVVFNHLYGIWATKKDFMTFCVDVLNIKSNYNTFNVQFDVNLLNAILAHEPFTIARFGAVHNLNSLRDTFVYAISKINEPSPNTYICDILQQKWKHRYNVVDVDVDKMTMSSILKTFIKYQLTNIVSDTTHNDIWKTITSFEPDVQLLTTTDITYMNKYEVVQYHLYRDNRFLFQLATYVVIVKDHNTDDVSNEMLCTLNKSVTQHLKKHCLILSIDCDKCNNVRFAYTIQKELFFLLPRISTRSYIISNDKHVSPKLLCSIPTECLLITKDPSLITQEQKSRFALILTHSIDHVSPHNSIYYLPCLDNVHVSYKGLYEQIQLYVLKEYNNLKSPFITQSSAHCGILFSNFISLYLSKNIVNMFNVLRSYSNQLNNTVSIVSIDNRYNVMTLFSVIVSLFNIVKHKQTKSYHGIIYTSRQFIDKYNDLIDSIGLSNLISVKVINEFDDVELFHMELYNSTLKNVEFWNTMDCDKCIVVQDDGFLMNGQHIDKYLEYDYVGAPWTDTKDNQYIKKNINSQLVGNGGFSIRSVEKMKHICQRFVLDKFKLFYLNINEIPEDVYFVKHLVQINANIAPFDVARQFAIEQVLSVNPVGFHKFWMYNLPTNTVNIFNSFID
jgi:hypothetical protein